VVSVCGVHVSVFVKWGVCGVGVWSL
jgi:hypothetical protein